MPDEIHVKGTVLAGVVRGAGADAKGPARDALLKRLDGELLEALQTNSLGPTVWYPVSWHRRILGFVTDDLGADQLGTVVRRSTRENIGTVHRALMRILSPETLIGRSAMIFRTFFEAKCEVETRGPGRAAVSWLGCHGFDRNCWIAQLLTVEELVSMTGAQQVRRNVLRGGRDNDSDMLIEVTWR
jgi:hypothetical protein